MFKRKSSSAVLLGSAAASMAACSAQNTAKASLNIYFDILYEVLQQVHNRGGNVTGLCKNFTWKNYVLDALKLPWSLYRGFSYDSWVALFREFRKDPFFGVLIGPFAVMILGPVWLAVQGFLIRVIYLFIKKTLNDHKQKENDAMLERLKKGTKKYDDVAKEWFSKEDFEFIKNIEEKYGEEYSNSLKESFLKYLLKCKVGIKTKSCAEYFKDFVLDNSESEEYFYKYKDDAKKDYGLIGPKVVTEGDKKFIDKELPKLTDELGFLKKNMNFESDKNVFEDFRKSYVEYCHLCNKRSKEEKEKDNLDSNNKDRNSLSAQEYFFGAYMNGISAKKAINGFEYLASGGNDYSVSKYWIEEDEHYGLTYKNKFIREGVLNYVSDGDAKLFDKMVKKFSGKKADEVKECFKNYVSYLHCCNKQFKKAEKGFKDFCNKANISFENLDKVTAEENN